MKEDKMMKDLNILYEDSHIIVCVKPAGVPVQTKKLGTRDMENILKNHLAHNPENRNNRSIRSPYLAVIHRLDQPVSGILVFAKTPAAAKALNRQLQKNDFTKEYQAVVSGHPKHSEGTLTDYLLKDGRTNTSRVCRENTPDAKYAELSYRVSRTVDFPPLSVLNIRLKTGRHHQIRVQMANAGTPLWGDNKYNPEFTSGRGYHPIALCANHLCFHHPDTHREMEFCIPCDWSHIF